MLIVNSADPDEMLHGVAFFILSVYHFQENFWDGPEPFYEKTMSDRVIWLGPIHKQFKSGVHFAVRY